MIVENKPSRTPPLLALLLVVLSTHAGASNDAASSTDTLDRKQVDSIVQRVADEFASHHFDRNIGRKVSAGLTNASRKGEYRKTTSAKALASQLTAGIFGLTQDLHARVQLKTTSEPPLNAVFRKSGIDLYRGADFERIDRLKGNIGYVKMQFFTLPEYFLKKSAAVMTMLADTDALIIDLRDAYGGDMKSVAYFCSFFIAQDKPLHLFTTRYRNREPTELWASETSQPYTRKPIYILTSKSTFSGAEAFVHTLKALKRATIIGEKTAGAANGALMQSIDSNLVAMIPAAETISVLTNSNWEHSGVAPDVATTKEQALSAAVSDYLNKAIPNASGSWEKTLRAVQSDVGSKGDSALFLRYAEKP